MGTNGLQSRVNPFNELNQLRLGWGRIKIWFTAGMGFFTDAYDLFIIGAVLNIFSKVSLPGFELKGTLLGLTITGFVAASAIITAIIGQLLFGFLADYWGRKKIYGVEAALMVIGALLSALAPNIYWLIAFRGILGLGIGGDYPVSSVIMSEYANVKDRGKLIALVFANQGLGTLAAILVGVLSAELLPPAIAWRVMLSVGALPALAVIYFRRKVPETPRYALLVKWDRSEAERAASVLGARISTVAVARRIPIIEFLRRYWFTLIVTAGTWFLMDVAFYGSGIYSGPITSSFIPISSSLPVQVQVVKEIIISGLPFLVGFPGYFTAVALMDTLGRRTIQILGFAMMAALYLTVVNLMIVHGTKVVGFLIPPSYALAIYALTFFFIDFGPNTTTFVVPAEVYPASRRTTGHGISAAAGKAGAAVATLLFPTLESIIGIRGILIIYAIAAIAGALLSIPLKEPKGVDLEIISEEEIIPVPV